MAVVTVYSTRGQHATKIETNATTWGELQKDLDANNIDYSEMKIIVGETKTVLELPSAVLPKGLSIAGKVTDDFTIFLSVAKQKAGNQ